MLLVVDIGNTNITLAPFADRECLGEYRLITDIQGTAADYQADLQEILQKNHIAINAGDSAVLSSVVPVLLPIWQHVLAHFFAKTTILESALYDRLPVKIPESAKKEIGSDLVANAVAAYTCCRGPVIVVDFGTALTFTAVAADGQIAGVAIAPGLRTAVNSLFANTAQLPQVQLAMPASSLGKNTEHSIQAGIVLGYKSLIEGLCAKIKDDLQAGYGIEPQKVPVVATGGLSAILAPHMPLFSIVDRLLTLRGLAIIGQAV